MTNTKPSVFRKLKDQTYLNDQDLLYFTTLPSFFREVSESKKHYFSTTKVQTQFGYPITKLKDDGYGIVLIDSIKKLRIFFRSDQSLVEVDPYLSLIHELSKDIRLDHITAKTIGNLVDDQAVQMVKMMNKLIIDFRKQTRHRSFKQLTRKHERVVQKNSAGAQDYIDYLFSMHSRLLVVRIDVGYGNEIKRKVTYQGVTAHKSQLIAYVQKKYPSFLGFIWKLEYTMEKKYHYHLIFFFNANHVRADVLIANDIGHYWCDEINQGNGVHFNCNVNKRQYEYPAIGEIKRHDQTKRNHLIDHVVSYLVKTDLFVRAKIPHGKRTFGRGEMLTNKKKKMRKNLVLKALK